MYRKVNEIDLKLFQKSIVHIPRRCLRNVSAAFLSEAAAAASITQYSIERFYQHEKENSCSVFFMRLDHVYVQMIVSISFHEN